MQGNENIHLLTSDNGRRYRLRVDLAIDADQNAYAEYSEFIVDSSDHTYRLSSLGTYNGTAGKSAWSTFLPFCAKCFLLLPLGEAQILVLER